MSIRVFKETIKLSKCLQKELLRIKTHIERNNQLLYKGCRTCTTKRKHYEDEFSIEPDIEQSVRATIKRYAGRNKDSNIITVPALKNQLPSTNYPDIGQPTPFTHPHFFDDVCEVTPGISQLEYAERRQKLMKLISHSTFGKNHENHVVLIEANSLALMSNDIPYPFHQDTDFLYLTGLNEPDAVLALEYNASSSRLVSTLFVKPKDPKKELWDGPVVGVDLAKSYFKSDEAYPLSSMSMVVKEKYGQGNYAIWLKKNDSCQNNNHLSSLVYNNSFYKKGVFNIGHNLQMLRLVKSEDEINIMKSSASIASKAFVKVMQSTKPGVLESQLHALLDFQCRIRGAQHLSFPPVVASGNRANTLHYINNTQVVRDGELILMDGGCEYNGYASDMTRTWPVNGVFTKEQKTIYNIVLETQKTCLLACKPGISLDQLHQLMMTSLADKLGKIGLIDASLPEFEKIRATRQFCPHHLGHYLGMDTHDTPLAHRGLPLQPGMVFTLEPGIYIADSMINVPKRYRGIGIRIEDNVAMTKNGPYVLTAELPKEVYDIETLLAP